MEVYYVKLPKNRVALAVERAKTASVDGPVVGTIYKNPDIVLSRDTGWVREVDKGNENYIETCSKKM